MDNAVPPRQSPSSPTTRASAFQIKLGAVVEWAGLLGLPMGVGIMLGYYAGDRGIRWLPTMLQIILGICILSLVAIIGGRLLARSATKATEGGLRLRRRIIVCLSFAMVLIAVRLSMYWVEGPSPLTDLTTEKFNAAFLIDAERFRDFDGGLARQLEGFRALSEEVVEGDTEILSADQEALLRELWIATYDYAFSLDQIRLFYEDWYRFDPSRVERSYHLRGFLLTYAAELALYEKSSRLLTLIDGSKNAVKFLNTPHVEAALGPDSFSHFREQLQGARDKARVIAGRRYLQWLETGLSGREEAQALGCAWLWDKVESELALIDAFSPIDLAALTVASDLEILKRNVRRVWYPTQKGVATFIGNTRMRRIAAYLITPELQEEMDPYLEPGDVMLSRRNWHMSNVGLPGFWPHAVLYIGGREKFEAYFDDEQVRAYLREIGRDDVSLQAYLALKHPSRWLRYVAGDGNEPYRVIEGIAAGIVLNTLDKACGDYMAVLRPRLDKRAKAQAIIEAFGHLDKPYDYNFDFATDHALVCTELVWRSYRPARNKQGLKLEPIKVAGRATLPANQIALVFAQAYGHPEAQFDFVYFIDASEVSLEAFVATEEAFLDTHKRTKWDFLLE
jgi:hypothetical protein